MKITWVVAAPRCGLILCLPPFARHAEPGRLVDCSVVLWRLSSSQRLVHHAAVFPRALLLLHKPMVSRQKPLLNTYSCRSFTAAISQTFSADTADSASRFDGHFRYFTNLLPLYRRRRLRASAAISETLPPRSPYSEPFNRSHVVELFVIFGASLRTRAGIYLDGRERLTGHRSTTIPVAVQRDEVYTTDS